MTFMLDASAVLAMLLGEPGGDFVADRLSTSQISVVNLSEVYATLLVGGMTFEEVQETIDPLPIRIRTFRDDHAIQTARLRPITKKYGLSFGDRACLTHAMFADLPVLTGDRRMAAAQEVLEVVIHLIR